MMFGFNVTLLAARFAPLPVCRVAYTRTAVCLVSVFGGHGAHCDITC